MSLRADTVRTMPDSELLIAAQNELETRIRQGRLRSTDDLKAKFPSIWSHSDSLLELVYTEYVLRTKNGEQPRREDWLARYPELRGGLERLFELYDVITSDTQRTDATIGPGLSTSSDPLIDHPVGYEILDELGRGGMAIVFQARHLALNRDVALKVLRWRAWDSVEETRRVRREAELVARIRHPNIVQVYEVGEWDGSPYLALEYVSGGTLAEALHQQQKEGVTGFEAREAAVLVECLARAVQAAHEHGVIHRDLKPANVLMADGQPKITDFGLAISAEASASVTQTAALAGTPCYMAPEQAASRRTDIGPRTDVYSLGGILYELMTGRPPFQGATVLEVLDSVRNADPIRPRILRPSLPRDLETIVLKCMEKDPARRYASAVALADDLRRFQEGRPILARPVGVVEKGWKWCRRKPVLAGMAAALLLLATGTLGIFWNSRRVAAIARERETMIRADLDSAKAKETMASAREAWDRGQEDDTKRLLSECPPALRDDAWTNLNAMVTAKVSSIAVGSAPSPAAVILSPSGRYVVLRGTQTATIHTIEGDHIGQIQKTQGRVFEGVFSSDDKTFSYHEACPFVPFVKSVYAYDDKVPDAETLTLRVIDLHSRVEIESRNILLRPGLTLRNGTRIELIDPKTLALIRLDTGERLRTIDCSSSGRLLDFAFDPSQRRMMTKHPRHITVHDLDSGTGQSYPFTPPGVAQGYKLHPDLRTIYFAVYLTPSPESKSPAQWFVIAWDLKDNRELFRFPRLPHHQGSLINFAISPSGALLALGWNPEIVLHDARTGQPIAELRGHKRYVPSLSFIPGRPQLISYAQDRQLITWDIANWDR